MKTPDIIEINGKKYVNSIDFHHNVLEINKTHYVKNIARWKITEYLFSDNEIRTPNKNDFIPLGAKSNGGRKSEHYLISLELSKMIAINSDSKVKKYYVQWLLSLEEKHEKGLAFNVQQIETLIDLSKSMVLVSLQSKYERNHFDLYNKKTDWYKHRAEILGYSTNDLIEAMKKVNKIHSSTRKSLIKLDANELIRTGIIDLMICMGKTTEYAVNVGNLCKSIAEKMDLGSHIWDDTKPNPLKINQIEINKCNEIFNQTLKSIEKL